MSEFICQMPKIFLTMAFYVLLWPILPQQERGHFKMGDELAICR